MSVRRPLMVSIALVALMLVASALSWHSLGVGRLALDWDANGRTMGYANALVALSMFPAVGLLTTLVFLAIPLLEPRRQNLVASRPLFLAAWFATLALIATSHAILLATWFKLIANPAPWFLAAVAAHFAVIANYLGKSRSTFFIGFRTPWGLSSEYSWEKSSRLAGRIVVATAALTILIDLVFGFVPAGWAFLAGIVFAATAATIAAYVHWQHDRFRSRDSDSLADP